MANEVKVGKLSITTIDEDGKYTVVKVFYDDGKRAGIAARLTKHIDPMEAIAHLKAMFSAMENHLEQSRGLKKFPLYTGGLEAIDLG